MCKKFWFAMVILLSIAVIVFLLQNKKTDYVNNSQGEDLMTEIQTVQNEPESNGSDSQVKPKPEVVVNEVAEQKLKFCPDIKINNMMPNGVDPNQPEENPIPSEYYIFEEERYELYEFDSNWLVENCSIEEETVY